MKAWTTNNYLGQSRNYYYVNNKQKYAGISNISVFPGNSFLNYSLSISSINNLFVSITSIFTLGFFSVINDQSFTLNDLNMYHLFIYLGLYVTFNTVQVISRRVVGMAKETSTYSWSRFCTVNCKQLPAFPFEEVWEPNPDLRGGRRECYHSATVAPEYVSGFYIQMILNRCSVTLNSI